MTFSISAFLSLDKSSLGSFSSFDLVSGLVFISASSSSSPSSSSDSVSSSSTISIFCVFISLISFSFLIVFILGSGSDLGSFFVFLVGLNFSKSTSLKFILLVFICSVYKFLAVILVIPIQRPLFMLTT